MIKIFTILPLVIEKSEDGFWGQVKINDNLIAEHSDSIEALKESMKSLIYAFEGIHVDGFEISLERLSSED